MYKISSEFEEEKEDGVSSTGWLCPDIESMYVKNFDGYGSSEFSTNLFFVDYCLSVDFLLGITNPNCVINREKTN